MSAESVNHDGGDVNPKTPAVISVGGMVVSWNRAQFVTSWPDPETAEGREAIAASKHLEQQLMARQGMQPGETRVEDVEPQIRHAIAARLLNGQPFGFTKRDVQALRDWAEWARWHNTWVLDVNGVVCDAEWLTSFADRIEALLPSDEDRHETDVG